MKLDGIIPRELSLLTGLVDLDLHGNDLQGVVPVRIVHALHNLQYLRLHMNGFFGALQREITGLSKLRELYLFGNYFGGTIPAELAELKHLQVIDLYANQLEGTIPSALGKLKQLKFLDLHDNNLTGRVPDAVCALKLPELIVDCLGPRPEVTCDCCTICCRGLPDFKCVDVKTGLEIQYGK
jgi:Leucine-rich repeat (LRR) protein